MLEGLRVTCGNVKATIFGLVILASGNAIAQKEDLRGYLEASQESSPSQGKVSYGPDNRMNPQETNNGVYLKLARATAVMLKKEVMELSGYGLFYKLNGKKMTEYPYQMCTDEKFAHEMNAGHCSGFLVAPDIIVTAGHCVRDEFACKNFRWAFDFRVDQFAKSERPVVRTEDVYSCKEIISQTLDDRVAKSNRDFAVIRLDRAVKGRTPVDIRRVGEVQLGDKLVVMGHPSGLPLKIADDATVRKNDHKDFFTADLDTFGGNSGSAVFNSQTGLVEGILVRGARDYVWDAEKKCRRVNQCEFGDPTCKGEDVTRITAISKVALKAISQ